MVLLPAKLLCWGFEGGVVCPSGGEELLTRFGLAWAAILFLLSLSFRGPAFSSALVTLMNAIELSAP